MARDQYYYIKHRLIGETILEYDPKSKTIRDLNDKTKLRLIDSNAWLLFRLEPANYIPRGEEETPCLAKLIADSKLTRFQTDSRFVIYELEIDPKRQ